MKIRWNIELIAGLASGGTGIIAWVYVLFGPFYSYASIDTEGKTSTGTASLVQHGLEPGAMVFLGLMFLSMIGIAIGACLHSQSSSMAERLLLFASAAILVAGAVISVLSVGLFLLPAALLALVAALAAGRSRRTPRPVS